MGLECGQVVGIDCPPEDGQSRTRDATLKRFIAIRNREAYKVADAYSNPMISWIVRIALETGMRLSEIADLRLGRVDLKRRVVRLEHTKNSSPRTVPLTPTATGLFQLALDDQLRPSDVDLLFLASQGKMESAGHNYSIRRGLRRRSMQVY